MSTPGILHFYYAHTMPARAIGIAQINATPSTPADLVDINNLLLTGPQGPGALTVTQYYNGRVFDAQSLNNTVEAFGDTSYAIQNQFFEIACLCDGEGNPLFYRHPFAVSGVDNVTVVGLDGTSISTGLFVENNTLYHSLDGAPYWVSYYANGLLRTDLLSYRPAMTRVTTPGVNSYSLTSGGFLQVSSAASIWVRFTATNGWQLLAPYNVPANAPWYPRVRFNLNPVPPEWGTQPFAPYTPYMLASWVPGAVLAPNLVEFERQPAYFDGSNYPDILVYDANWNLKYALDGSDPTAHIDKGFLFPWMRSQFLGIDAAHARCQVTVPLDPTDQPFAFYCYAEKDVVFRALDINPFTRPALKDTVIEFYLADRSGDIPPRTSENTHE